MLGRPFSVATNYFSTTPGKQALKTPRKDKVRDTPATDSHEKGVGGVLHYCAFALASQFALVYRLSLADQDTQSLRKAHVHYRIIGGVTRTLFHQFD